MNLKHFLALCIYVPSLTFAQCPKTDQTIQQFIDYNEMLTPLESAIGVLENYHQQRPDCQWQAQRNKLIASTDYKDIPYGERDKVCNITKKLIPHYHLRLNALWGLSCEKDVCQEEAENLLVDYPFIRTNRSKLFLVLDSTQKTINKEFEGSESFQTIELKYKSLNQLCGDAKRTFLFTGDYPQDKNTSINQLIDSKLSEKEKAAKYDAAQGADYIKNLYDEAYFVLDHTDNLIYKDPYLLSMRVDLYQYTGGAHGNANSDLISYDLIKNQKITLEELIDPKHKTAFLSYAREAFKEQLFVEGEQDWKNQDFWFEPGKAPEEHQPWSLEDGFYLNDNFALVNHGILFIYQPYEISPWSRGIPRLFLSIDKIQPYLRQQDYLKDWLYTD